MATSITTTSIDTDTLGVTGNTTITGNATAGTIALGGRSFNAGNTPLGVNFSSASGTGLQINDTNSGNLGGMLQFYSGSGGGTLRANIQNANNAGVHFCVGTGGSVVFTQNGYIAANALDDYEEGFYTPTYGATAGYGNQTYTSRQGVYTKIGNIVKVWVDMTLSANSSQAGIPVITLPFAAASSANLGTDSVGSQRYEMGSWTPWAVDSSISSGLTTGWIANGDSHMTMYRWSGSYNYGHTNLPLNATGRISGTIWYTAAF